MRNDRRSKLHILLIAMILLLFALPAKAESEEPLTLTVEADPDCFLSEAGDMTWFRFTVKNTLEEDYTLEYLTLQGDLIDEAKLIAESITIPANDVLEFTLENVHIEEFEFDMDLSFQLAWQTTRYAPEDEGYRDPIVTEHVVAADPLRIERFVEPVMTLSFFPDSMLAREGDTITVTYTLTNDTKFDMTNITLQDIGIPQQNIIPLEKNVLNAGETMEVSTTFTMGAITVELNPTAQYTVRGVESKTSAAAAVAVELVEIDLKMEVEKYPATSEGTLFRITLINNGTHPVTDIRIMDEIGTLIASGINLEAGSDRTVSYTIPSAVSSGTVRYISFEATGTDCLGGSVTTKSLSAYEILPFVESDQVQLQLTVTLAKATQSDDGSSNMLKLLFEVRNDSEVPIQNAVITEGDYFKGVVNEYATLSAGITSFEKEFIVPTGTRSLTFVLTAMDPAQTQYASAPMTLDLSPLTAPKPTSPPAIKPGKKVDITGTIYDTDRYVRIFRMSALIVLALTLMFLLLSIIFHVAETNIRRWLPKEPLVRPFGPRRTPTGPLPVREGEDPVHDQFGYMQPAKLRYMDRTDRLPVVQEETFTPVPSVTAPINLTTKSIPVVQNTNASRKKEGDITAVPVRKPRRPVMISADRTMPFAPIHEEQAAEAEEEIKIFRPKMVETPAPVQAQGRLSAQPREIILKPMPRIVPRQKVEIVRVIPS